MAAPKPGGGTAPSPLIAAKLAPPAEHAALIPRPRLTAAILDSERVSLVIAPPGYGKTVLARQVVEVSGPRTGWLSLDRLDEHPAAFWLHLHTAARTALPDIDREPERLLLERGPEDPLHLGALLAQLDQVGEPGLLVLDDVGRLGDDQVLDGLATLVERAGDRLRLVLTARWDPALPVARWRAAGWLTELRADSLRFDGDEAELLGTTVHGVMAEQARSLRHRTDGWPIALQLALGLLAQDGETGTGFPEQADGLLADYLVTEVLDRLPEPVATTALQLSVVERFDTELCRDLLGPAAVASLLELRRRRVFLDGPVGMNGTLEFPSLVRTLLGQVHELRDPEGRMELHRRAAELFDRRGDLLRSLHHLQASGDHLLVGQRVLNRTLQLSDLGHREALSRLLDGIRPDIVVHPRAALAVGTACLFGGREADATAWRQRAVELGATGDPATGAELEAFSAAAALLGARLDEAWGHVQRRVVYEPLEVDGPLNSQFATTVARIALGREDRQAARHWVGLAGTITEPPTVSSVTVPALQAWLALDEGEPDAACSLALGAVRESELMGSRPRHGSLEALVVAAWCLLARGELSEAAAIADLAQQDADALGWPWSRYRATLVAAEVKRLQGDIGGADLLLSKLGEQVRLEGLLAQRRHQAVIRVLLTGGRYDSARRLLSPDDPDPRARLLAARLALHDRDTDTALGLLSDQATWPDTAARLEAQVLLAILAPPSEGQRLATEAVIAAAATGWTSPFLGQGRRASELLAGLPLQTLHPRLARALATSTRSRMTAASRDILTDRELTLLELLPTHLSYAEMGATLFLSVNTVKSNLKSVYRKLGASSRSGAIDAARRRGLL